MKASTALRAYYRLSRSLSFEERHKFNMDEFRVLPIAQLLFEGMPPFELGAGDVAPAGPLWQAEPEHQDYLERYPNGYTCHFLRPNWKLPHRAVAV